MNAISHIELVKKKRKIHNLPPLPPPSTPPLFPPFSPPCLSPGSGPLRTLDCTRARAHAGGSRHGNTRLKLLASVMLLWKVPDKAKRYGWDGGLVRWWLVEVGGFKEEKVLMPSVSSRAPCDGFQAV